MEDHILARIDIEAALARLHPADREMIVLIFCLERPTDWTFRWPPKYEDIGVYIGLKYEDRPLSEAAIRYRRDVVLGMWKGTRGALRRGRDES